jgi:hypothetical protein
MTEDTDVWPSIRVGNEVVFHGARDGVNYVMSIDVSTSRHVCTIVFHAEHLNETELSEKVLNIIINSKGFVAVDENELKTKIIHADDSKGDW